MLCICALVTTYTIKERLCSFQWGSRWLQERLRVQRSFGSRWLKNAITSNVYHFPSLILNPNTQQTKLIILGACRLLTRRQLSVMLSYECSGWLLGYIQRMWWGDSGLCWVSNCSCHCSLLFYLQTYKNIRKTNADLYMYHSSKLLYVTASKEK